MTETILQQRTLTWFIAFIWAANGLIKVLNIVPRHREIVSRILGERHATFLTMAIGISELAMAGWVLSRFKARWNAVIQIFVIAAMNMLEFFLVPDLLLWGRMNAFFALL